jgi:hypothetical protein
VTLDGVTQLGARKDIGAAGILQGGLLFSGIPTQVWEDPYAEGVRRKETDRDSTGVRVEWDRILGTAFDLTFSYRDISIDTDRSGEGVTSVSCDAVCQELLRRDGDQYSFDVSYLYRLGEGGRHLVRPMVRYTTDDRDGEAIIETYCAGPYPMRNRSERWAWGSGRDFALAAMHLGKTAAEAVEVACLFQSDCGLGVDHVEL